MQTWNVRGVTAVLTVIVLATGLRAADLGFPESCVELANMTPRGLASPPLADINTDPISKTKPRDTTFRRGRSRNHCDHRPLL